MDGIFWDCISWRCYSKYLYHPTTLDKTYKEEKEGGQVDGT